VNWRAATGSRTRVSRDCAAITEASVEGAISTILNVSVRGDEIVDLDRRRNVRDDPEIVPLFVEQPDRDADVHGSGAATRRLRSLATASSIQRLPLSRAR
jgi:hypothetical protein